MKKILFLIMASLLTTSCDWMFFWEDDEVVEVEKGEKSEKPAAVASNEKSAAPDKPQSPEGEDQGQASSQAANENLKIAQLSARIDQLEAEVRRQRENFHVLRKGLMTGLIPSDWRDDIPKYSKQFGEESDHKSGIHSNKDEAMSVILGAGEGAGDRGFSGLTEKQARDYEQRLAQANQYFRAAQYGKAIAAYERIGEDFSDKVTKGNHLLWIGAGWYSLHDFQLARKSLTKLITMYKSSPWVPEAEFLLAKVDFKESFVERSLERLRGIIQQYPNQNIAQRAKEELKRVEEHL